MTKKRRKKINTISGIVMILVILLMVFGSKAKAYYEHIDGLELVSSSIEVMPEPPYSQSVIIEKIVDQYAKSPSQRSWLLSMIHCLLNKESVHYANKKMGDGGLAGGPLQYHQATYVGYRKLMIKQGLVEVIGSRFDFTNAVETTVWALMNGRKSAWGPVLNGLCK